MLRVYTNILCFTYKIERGRGGVNVGEGEVERDELVPARKILKISLLVEIFVNFEWIIIEE